MNARTQTNPPEYDWRPAHHDPIWPLIFMVAATVIYVWVLQNHSGLAWHIPFWSICGIVAVWYLSNSGRRYSRVIKAIQESNGVACIRCLRNLSQYDDPCHCPHCGNQFTHEELRVYWHRCKPRPYATREPIWSYPLLVIPVALAFFGKSLGSQAAFGLAIGSMFVVGLTILSVRVFNTGKVEDSLNASGGLSCARCLYNLSKLPTEGQCPKCSTPYTHVELRAMWKYHKPGGRG